MTTHSDSTNGALLLLAFRAVTVLGSVPVTFGIACLVAVVFACRRRWAAVITWLAIFLGTAATVAALKVVVRRTRPATAVPGFGDLRWSFPSGHTALAVVTYGLFTYVLVRTCDTRYVRVGVSVVGILLVLAIAASRIALGMHYLSDVIGGLIVGGCWACIGIVMLGRDPATPLSKNHTKHPT